MQKLGGEWVTAFKVVVGGWIYTSYTEAVGPIAASVVWSLWWAGYGGGLA